ncbi:hypothetical protein BLNAU_18858 [Blattamonas nauphoetae]|uniref:Uncharacterized protein n=1 Tax=Blattamonas nauphoetae TaxID=2049346 RepID=A0ABQ9X5K2_9EUKA|nr:hypothetical protein BLNAU_18858 [Blattamonas nauphoetae]
MESVDERKSGGRRRPEEGVWMSQKEKGSIGGRWSGGRARQAEVRGGRGRQAEVRGGRGRQAEVSGRQGGKLRRVEDEGGKQR